MHVSIILPCYNERGNVISLAQEIHETLKGTEHEIIIIDDNSPDGTYQALLELNASYIKPILRTRDPSLAKSIRCGVEHASGNYIIIMDSDFNHRPQDLPIMLANLSFFDCVIASRFVYGGRMESHSRQICSWLFNIFIRMLTQKYITDSLFGFIAIKKSLLDELNFDDIFWGYGDYGIRLMYYLQQKQITILQIPGILGKRLAGVGNQKLFSTLLLYIKATLQLVFKRKKHGKDKAMPSV